MGGGGSTGTGGQGERPAHWLTRDEGRRWVAGSALPRILRHTTSGVRAEQILRVGFRLDEAAADSAFGRGIYASTRFEPAFGDASIEVAVRLELPLILAHLPAGIEPIEQLLSRFGTDDVREAVLLAGYDGIILEDAPGGGTWAVAFYERAVRVIRERR